MGNWEHLGLNDRELLDLMFQESSWVFIVFSFDSDDEPFFFFNVVYIHLHRLYIKYSFFQGVSGLDHGFDSFILVI